MTKRDSKLPNSAGVNRGGTMRKYLYELAEAAKGAAATAVEVTEAATATATEATKAVITTATEIAISAADCVKNSAETVITTVLDQDGDGKLDQEDLRILTQKGTEIGKVMGTKAALLASEAAKSEIVKDAVAAAAVGAAIGVALPLVGPAAGAVVGATLGAHKNLTKK
ncbi:MAG: hypothetical protein IT471_00945 [Pseudomonadales bacterium]|nr:hypothetical protein [Pseudomonadales bacterium]MCC6528813.1 hypothetical protein [Pseudomonadales bacterium]MCP5331831.1 hypothetical protein [Pseudomonadales bacterium]HMZ91650.1 hypothetical protein [Pseudomonadales bacterium]HNF07910.1 hypothetical protein [Pseudomonadales bacterium]